jgi:ADP-ribose pyrophosphatase YjhB (NUDIX family)
LEFGHTPQEDIVRELKEEAGLKVTRVDKRPLYVVTKKKKNKDVRLVIIIYEAKVKNLNLIPSKECQEL